VEDLQSPALPLGYIAIIYYNVGCNLILNV